jgi:uncharacterized membrane protein YkvA (DUF1232 family)
MTGQAETSQVAHHRAVYRLAVRARLRTWSRSLKAETHALYLAVRDPRTPWYAKALGICIVAYALSPIDLIPDFIPILGYLDDILIVPAGLWIVRRLIPRDVLAKSRERARTATVTHSRKAAAIIVTIWLAGLALAGLLVWRLLR